MQPVSACRINPAYQPDEFICLGYYNPKITVLIESVLNTNVVREFMEVRRVTGKSGLLLVLLLAFCQAFAVNLEIPAMPEATSNNAVAQVQLDDATYLLSFMGLGTGKDYHDVHNKAWKLKLGDPAWQTIAPVPSSLPLKGRLASVAVGVAGKAYIFGGYTVAQDHSEISSPDNFSYDLRTDSYLAIAQTPVPVDDAIALVYDNRYIYLISGWHNDGNVNLTQVYDIKTNSWQQASPFLGQPVFGHAGGIAGDTMLVCDGVKVVANANRRRGFAAETACYSGTIQKDNPYRIDWRTIPHPTGQGRYRMAAAGIDRKNIIFIGGAHNPYNYNGIGYNGKPAEPDNGIWRYDLQNGRWHLTQSEHPSMDHRALVVLPNNLVTVGGMLAGQKVTGEVLTHPIGKVLKQ